MIPNCRGIRGRQAKLDAFAGRDVVKGVEYVDVPDNTRDSTIEHTGDAELAWTGNKLQPYDNHMTTIWPYGPCTSINYSIIFNHNI